VVEVIGLAGVRIRNENIVEPVAIVIANRGCGPTGCEHSQDIGVWTFEMSCVVMRLQSGLAGDFREPDSARRLSPGKQPQWERQSG
jgi:hypothetical protein